MTEKASDDCDIAIEAYVFHAIGKAYDAALVIDDPREEATAEFGRVVLREYPAPWPRRNPEGDAVKLPIRVVREAGMAFRLEIGPYDFGEVDVDMLRQAIVGYDREVTVNRVLQRDSAVEINDSSLQHHNRADT